MVGERAGIRTGIDMKNSVIRLMIMSIQPPEYPAMAPSVIPMTAAMPVVTAVIVLIFGGLTLLLHDELFIKLKPTIIYVLFGGTLVGGLLFGKPLLGIVFDSVFHLSEEGWRKLTWRWALFFFALAILNEIVWRTQTTDFWVSFKLFGVVPLTFLFAALQYPLLTKYSIESSDKG